MAENTSIIARPYQLDLVDHLCEENGILYLPTRAGKTFVSILVLRRLSSATQHLLSKGGKRTVYMCNSAELARQQCIEIRKCVNLKVGLYIGDRGVDTWNVEEWRSEFEENQVLVGTAEVFVDCVAQNFIKVTDFNLVIVDECHHATKGHPMHTFLSLIQNVKKSDQPRIIGLTKVLIKGNKLDSFKEELRNLEAAFSGKIVTVHSNAEFANVMLCSTKPREHVIVYNRSNTICPIESKIEKVVDEWKNVVKCFDTGSVRTQLTKSVTRRQESNKKKIVINVIDDFLHQMKDLGLYTASVAITLCTIDLEQKKRLVQSNKSLYSLYRYSIMRCEHIKHILMKKFKTSLMEADTSNSCFTDTMCDTKDIILKYSSPKMVCFLNTLRDFFKGKDAKDIICLVFVQRRFSAQCLYHVLLNYLKECNELKNVIIPQYIVGRQNISCSTQSILHNKWNSNIMQQFRKKECNLIICSNIFEEGIDVQACNYVFILDDLTTFNSYILTKGRARSLVATYAMFCNELNLVSLAQKIITYKSAHENIKQFLMERILINDASNTVEISQHFLPKIPPYKTSSGAHLVAPLAISVLNQYCHSLPWDIFGGVLPWFYKVPTTSGFQVALQLPLQSRLKETIKSDVMQNAKEARISAAFKACIKLYELGELNEHLLPISERECIEKASEHFFQNWKKYTNEGLKSKQLIGKNHLRLYNTQCPDELYDALPEVGQKCYGYSIIFNVDFPKNNYNAHVVNYLNAKSTFAFLLRKRLPNLAEMPLFMSQGKLRVKISREPIECTVHSDEQLEKLMRFHIMLFRDLLKLWQEFFVIDRRNKENTYLIAPLNSEECIDWDLVENCQRLLPMPPYTRNGRNQKVFRPEDFIGKVVTKSYSNVPNEYYAVIGIRHDLNPMSNFGKTQYKNYIQFYKLHHSLDVTNETQFLLEVKVFTARRNFFINPVSKTGEIKRELSDTILIPELCKRFEFPAYMWLKALFLPTIIHRVYYMLHAEDLRQTINTYLHLDKYFSQYKPNALIVDTSLKRAVDDCGRIVEDKDDKKYRTNATPKMYVKDSEKTSFNVVSVPWKEYMEPIDCVRRMNEISMLEIDYYHKFNNGLIFDMQNLNLTDEEIWSKSQFEFPNFSKPLKTLRAIAQSNLNIDKYHLDILERSFKDASELQSAEQHEFLAAITTATVNDVFDMERFELLGDAFLKISVSLYLVNRYPEWNEGYLSVVRGRVVSNLNLLYCMLNMNICNRVCGSLFAPHNNWLPPLVSLPSNLLKFLSNSNWPIIANSHNTNFQELQLTEEEICKGTCYPAKLLTFVKSCQSMDDEEKAQSAKVNVNLESDMNKFVYKEAYRDKVMADTLEALLGVCVKNYGIRRSFKMLEFFGIVKPDTGLSLRNLLDLKFDFSHLRFNVKREEIDGFLINGHILEENLGYKFRDRAYLLQAITHPSNPTNRLTGSYQELEFIGDAILDMLITCYIFERNQHMTPGMMTDMRMALVNNITLGCACVRHRFHLFMLYENAALSEAIKKFADFQETQNYCFSDQMLILIEEEANNNLYDEEESSVEINNSSDYATQGLTDKKNYDLSKNVDVPKALGGIVEALIAAVYLDSRDLRTTWRIIYNLLEPEIVEFSNQVPKDPVRQLNEHTLANDSFSKPLRDNEVFMVKCVFTCMNKTIEVDGFGSTANHAKKAAAKRALRILSQINNQ